MSRQRHQMSLYVRSYLDGLMTLTWSSHTIMWFMLIKEGRAAELTNSGSSATGIGRNQMKGKLSRFANHKSRGVTLRNSHLQERNY